LLVLRNVGKKKNFKHQKKEKHKKCEQKGHRKAKIENGTLEDLGGNPFLTENRQGEILVGKRNSERGRVWRKARVGGGQKGSQKKKGNNLGGRVLVNTFICPL